MTTFQDFVRWYNNKDVVKDKLKLGYALPNFASICQHKSTNNKFYPFVEADKDLHDKKREDKTGGPSIVYTRKAVVD